MSFKATPSILTCPATSRFNPKVNIVSNVYSNDVIASIDDKEIFRPRATNETIAFVVCICIRSPLMSLKSYDRRGSIALVKVLRPIWVSAQTNFKQLSVRRKSSLYKGESYAAVACMATVSVTAAAIKLNQISLSSCCLTSGRRYQQDINIKASLCRAPMLISKRLCNICLRSSHEELPLRRECNPRHDWMTSAEMNHGSIFKDNRRVRSEQHFQACRCIEKKLWRVLSNLFDNNYIIIVNNNNTKISLHRKCILHSNYDFF